MKYVIVTAASVVSLLLGLDGPSNAMADPTKTASQPQPFYTVKGTKLGVLLDNAATKAILQKYIPDVIGNPQIVMARGITLAALAPYTGGKLSNETLAKIDADLSKIPPPKMM